MCIFMFCTYFSEMVSVSYSIRFYLCSISPFVSHREIHKDVFLKPWLVLFILGFLYSKGHTLVNRGSVHKTSFGHWAINVADLFHTSVDIFTWLLALTICLLYIIITFMSQSKASFITKDTNENLLYNTVL